MQRRRSIKCPRGARRFTMISVNGARPVGARSFETAMKIAVPRRGDKLDVYAVCAPNQVVARTHFEDQPKELLRSFTFKRRR